MAVGTYAYAICVHALLYILLHCYRAEQMNFRAKMEKDVLRIRALEYPKSGPAGSTDPYDF